LRRRVSCSFGLSFLLFTSSSFPMYLFKGTSKNHEPLKTQRHREKRGRRKASPVFSPLTFSVPLCLCVSVVNRFFMGF
jgi:hypothetical protein